MMTPQHLAEIRNRSVDSMSAEALHNPDIWTLAADRDALLAEIDRFTAERDQRAAAIRQALDGIPPTGPACTERHCLCHEGGRR